MLVNSNDAENDKEKVSDSTVYTQYMKKLNQWSHDRKCYYWMWNHYFTMQSYVFHMHMMNSVTQASTSANSEPSTPPQNSQNVTQSNQNPSSNEYRIPTMFRRTIAEILDFVFLLIIKTAGLYIIMFLFDLNLSVSLQSDGLFNSKLIKLLLDDENSQDWLEIDKLAKEQLASFEGDLSLLAIITILYRIFTGVYEWLFIWAYGATPGKHLLGIKVITCTTATRNQSGVVAVNPGTPVTSSSALTRSLLKNVMISLMIPAFLSAFFSSCKRTNYDEMSRTIVVYRPASLRRR